MKPKTNPNTRAKRQTKRPLRIGLYDGTFSPIHYGHLICAERTRQVKGLDMVLFLTCGNPPNKAGVLDAEIRHEMVVATVSDNPPFRSQPHQHQPEGRRLHPDGCRRGAQAVRRGHGVLLPDQFRVPGTPNHKWFLGNWTGGKELFKQVQILVFPRDKHEVAKIEEWAKLVPQARIEAIEVPSPELSSTMIRDSVVRGRSIWYRLPWVTQQMINKYDLYKTAENAGGQAHFSRSRQWRRQARRHLRRSI